MQIQCFQSVLKLCVEMIYEYSIMNRIMGLEVLCRE